MKKCKSFYRISTTLKSIFHALLVYALLFTPVNAKPLTNIQLATSYQNPADITQYLISEKLDGVRGHWTGKKLLTKQGNVINAPSSFTKDWPNIPLDGELWEKRNNFDDTSACIRKKINKKSLTNACWSSLKFMVFDAPTLPLSFEKRYQKYKGLIARVNLPTLHVIKQYSLSSVTQLTKRLDEIVNQNGEGLMLHRKSASYQAGRSSNLMKLKKYKDTEAIVIKHIEGKGKYVGMMGSLLVKTTMSDDFPTQITFKVGSGFSDEERNSPPNIGDTITLKYFGKTNKGTPKFASFMRVRKTAN